MAQRLIVGKDDRPRLEAWFGTLATSVSGASIATALTLTVYDPTGYADGDTILVRAGHDRAETRVIAPGGVNVTTGVLTLTVALRFAHNQDEPVMRLTAPTAIALTYQSPSQAVASTMTTKAVADLNNPSIGYYYHEPDMSEEGGWRVRWKATGAVVAATDDDDIIDVQSTGVA